MWSKSFAYVITCAAIWMVLLSVSSVGASGSDGPTSGSGDMLDSEMFLSDTGACAVRKCTVFKLPTGIPGVFAPGGTRSQTGTNWNGHAGGNGDILLTNDTGILFMHTDGTTNVDYISKLQTGNTYIGVTAGNYVGFNFGDILRAYVQQRGVGGMLHLNALAFASLGTGSLGDIVICSDCNVTCTAGGGTGKPCVFYNSVWNPW